VSKKSADSFRMTLSSQHNTLSSLCLPACCMLFISLLIFPESQLEEKPGRLGSADRPHTSPGAPIRISCVL